MGYPFFLYQRRESNPHIRGYTILSRARLPVPPLWLFYLMHNFKTCVRLPTVVFNEGRYYQVRHFGLKSGCKYGQTLVLGKILFDSNLFHYIAAINLVYGQYPALFSPPCGRTLGFIKKSCGSICFDCHPFKLW